MQHDGARNNRIINCTRCTQNYNEISQSRLTLPRYVNQNLGKKVIIEEAESSSNCMRWLSDNSLMKET